MDTRLHAVLKKEILLLIENSDLSKAKELLYEYEQLEPNDFEIFSIRAVLAMKNGEFSETEKIILAGLKRKNDDFDLLYNLAYLYECQKNYQKAIEIYQKISKQEIDAKEKIMFVSDNIQRLQNYVLQLNQEKHSDLPIVTIGIVGDIRKTALTKCLDSIFNQEYKNLEVFIWINGNKECLLDTIKEYKAKSSLITINIEPFDIRNENEGLRNLQEKATGKYFICICANTFFSNQQVIGDCVKTLESNKDIDFLYGNFNCIDPNNGSMVLQKFSYHQPAQIVLALFTQNVDVTIPVLGFYKTAFFSNNKIQWGYDAKTAKECTELNILTNIKHNLNYYYVDKVFFNEFFEKDVKDIRQEVQDTIAVLEYIVKNFSEKWFLPDVRWHEVNDLNFKKSIINFYLGTHYCQIYQQIASSYRFDFSGLELVKKLYPIEKKMIELFLKSKKNNKVFCDDINVYQNEFNQFKENLTLHKSQAEYSAPRVSIIIPVLDEFIDLQSYMEKALAQEYAMSEILVIAIRSKMNQAIYMNDYLLDQRLKYYEFNTIEDLGKTEVISLVRGDYIFIMSQDNSLSDELYLNKIIPLALTQGQKIQGLYEKYELENNLDMNKMFF